MSKMPIDRRTWLLALGAALAARAGARGTRTGFDALVGGWSRSDGDYHIVIQSVGADGLLQASYFNPRPLALAVAQARRRRGAKALQCMHASNCAAPATKGRLMNCASIRRAGGWSAPTGRHLLVGTYYQAVAKQTRDVEFQRE